MTEQATNPPTLRDAITAIEALAAEARNLRASMKTQNRLLIVAIAAAFAAILATAWVTWDNHVTTEKLQRVTTQNQADIAEANQKWCPIIGAILQPQGPPPTTERGQQMVNLLSNLFVDYGCRPDAPN